MDDYLDQELDKLNDKTTLAIKLNRALLPYSLLLYTFAVLIDPQLAVALFWAGYIVGMGFDETQLPTKLKAYQESLLLAVAGFIWLDNRLFSWALAGVLFIQLSDDLIDYHKDPYVSRTNFVNYLGRIGTVLLAAVALGIAGSLNFKLTIVLGGVAVLLAWLLG